MRPASSRRQRPCIQHTKKGGGSQTAREFRPVGEVGLRRVGEDGAARGGEVVDDKVLEEGEGIALLELDRKQEACHGGKLLGTGGGSESAGYLPEDDDWPQRTLGGVVGRRHAGLGQEGEERGEGAEKTGAKCLDTFACGGARAQCAETAREVGLGAQTGGGLDEALVGLAGAGQQIPDVVAEGDGLGAAELEGAAAEFSG